MGFVATNLSYEPPILSEQEQKEHLRKKIDSLETAMKSLDKGQIEIDTSHFWGGGIYARQIFIPKGSVAIGKYHHTNNLNVIASGKVSIATEDGIKIVEGPHTFEGKKGIRRAGYAHEDTVWITFHVTEERDVDEIEKIFIAQSYEEFLSLEQDKQFLEEK